MREPASWNGVASRLNFWSSVKITAPQFPSGSPRKVLRSGPTVVPAVKPSATWSITMYLFFPFKPSPWICQPLMTSGLQYGDSLRFSTSTICVALFPRRPLESTAYMVTETCFKLVGGSKSNTAGLLLLTNVGLFHLMLPSFCAAVLHAFCPMDIPLLQKPGTILNIPAGDWLSMWTVRSSFSGSAQLIVWEKAMKLTPNKIVPSSKIPTVLELINTSGASLTSSINTVTSPWADSFGLIGSRALTARVISPWVSASSWAQLLGVGQLSFKCGAWIAATRKPLCSFTGVSIVMVKLDAQIATSKYRYTFSSPLHLLPGKDFTDPNVSTPSSEISTRLLIVTPVFPFLSV